MQGIRKGLATLIKMENPAALSVHCFAHCLNLCLHEAGRNLVLLRDALDTARNCKATCINYFSKKVQPLNEKLVQSEAGHTGVSIKLSCPTRWTARSAAINAVLKDYTVLIEAMEEINLTTRDEYGLKAEGLLNFLQMFCIFFGLRLSYVLFTRAEEVSRILQAKDTRLQDALKAICLLKGFF